MTVEELIIYGNKYCHKDIVKIILADIINKNSLELLNYLKYEVEDEKVEEFQKKIKAINEGIPLQYAMGKVNFYGNEFIINQNVLIPRFETEELVENTIKYINKHFTEPVDIIDLGCGSGAIGLTLEKKVSTKSVDLIDISEKALEITHKNCEKLNSKANIIQSDMFTNVEKKYDIIISNPPYIKTTEQIEDIVKNNEPHIALYAGEDGLDCYKKILENAPDYMKERCIIAFEIGYQQADAIKELAYKYLNNINIIVKKDLSEKDRMLFIFKNIQVENE